MSGDKPLYYSSGSPSTIKITIGLTALSEVRVKPFNAPDLINAKIAVYEEAVDDRYIR